MSFVTNITHNETMHYWRKKLKGKWYKWIFLFLKNLEIDIFCKNIETIDKSIKSNIDDKKVLNFKKNNNINPSDKEHIAVICPFFITDTISLNQLLRFIESLNNQILPPSIVILIDDASPFPYILPPSSNTKLIRLEHNKGPAYARNVGIKVLQKDSLLNIKIIAFSDSDVIVSKNWLEQVFLGFVDNPDAFGISGITKSLGNTLFDIYHDINGTLNGRMLQDYNTLLYAPTCNLALLFSCFECVSFDEDFPNAAGEDIVLCFYLMQNGYRIAYNSNMIVYHDFNYTPYNFIMNLKKMKKLFKKYAKGEKLLLSKIPNYYDFLNKSIEIQNPNYTDT